jgi:hypothetical protein
LFSFSSAISATGRPVFHKAPLAVPTLRMHGLSSCIRLK